MPTPVKNQAIRRPLKPLPVTYSSLPMKKTCRSQTSGRIIESMKVRWLPARMTGPSPGMCSAPSTRGRNIRRMIGPSTALMSAKRDNGPSGVKGFDMSLCR